MKPRRLKIARLDEISLVDRGANPLARVLVWKRDTTPEKEMPQDKTEALGLLRKIADAFGFARELATDDKSVQKRVEQMPNGKWMAMNHAGEKMGEFDSKEEAEAAAYGKKQEKKMADETVTKADFEKMQERLTKAEADAVAAKADATARAEKVAKLETERRTADFIKRAGTYAPLPIGKADAFAVILMKAADVLTTEENAELDRVLTAAAEIAKTAGLLKEHGSDSHEEGTAAAKVAAKVADLRKANPKLTEALAKAQVYKSDPALRREVEAENTERAQAGR